MQSTTRALTRVVRSEKASCAKESLNVPGTDGGSASFRENELATLTSKSCVARYASKAVKSRSPFRRLLGSQLNLLMNLVVKESLEDRGLVLLESLHPPATRRR